MFSVRRSGTTTALIFVLTCLPTSPLAAHPEHDGTGKEQNILPGDEPREWHQWLVGARSQGPTPCVNGFADSYPCNGVDLLSFMPLNQIGGGKSNDLWGWTDPETGREYALLGRTNGTSFIEITNPTQPVYLGHLPSHKKKSIWRDLKVHNNHAFIVSEAAGHGMQVFDLTALRGLDGSPPAVFTESAHYAGFGNAHNLVLNEATGYAYAVGTATCGGGLHIIDLTTPTAPAFSGCFSADGYTHDAQCVLYLGPDADYQGSEICFAANEDTLTIVDVTTKTAPVQISRESYTGVGYTHQLWLTPDHKYLLADDEFDELLGGHPTRTYIWDIRDLDQPVAIGIYSSSNNAIDHNQYIVGDKSYQANYRAGLRILDIDEVAQGALEEIAFFDTYPTNDKARFNGAWSVYPFFVSGTVIVSGIEQGLYILRLTEGLNVHISDLDRKRWRRGSNRWVSRSRIVVRDEFGQPVAAAVVTGIWSNGKVTSCTTTATGRCKTKTKNPNTRRWVEYTVVNVRSADATYDSFANHDPDPDSDGTTIRIKRPRMIEPFA